MKVNEIVNFIEKTAPKELAESWDSPGLKTGSLNKEINKILVCLDVSKTVVEEAVEKGCNMIISHHPVLFRPIGYICEDTEPALCMAIKNDIAIYSAHTNLDFAVDGINDVLAKQIGLVNIQKDESGKHAYGNLAAKVEFDSFLSMLKNNLSSDTLMVSKPNGQMKNGEVYKIGVSSGGFDNQTQWAVDLGLDVLVTGEIKHSDYVTLQNESIIVIAAGHYYTEIPGMKKLTETLNKQGFKAILSEKEKNPFVFL